ncbi:RecQ family ATP-dependent DNA helicase [Agathobaculum sp.]|uniref:RecQ family ATP-dependent DNA helicase n=1 Tax=Agathobaculum sp. TaxID=2048138 RepID=UPI003AB1CA56
MTNKQEKLICNTFGISKLKPFQKKVIKDLSDGRDVLALARTSEGKSICFLSMITLHPKGLLIGILPTVALMRDLVQRCEDSKIRAGCLYSGNAENTNIIERLKYGKLQALFVAPERLNDPHLWKAIQKNKVHTVVVDEVHCLTEWGSEFRPMYRNIGKFIKDLPNSPVVAAFSATVMPDDIPYIVKSLHMKNPVVHIGKLKRSNLSLKKAFVKNDAARYAKVSKTIQKCGSKGKIVIYCTRVCDVEDMRDFLIEDCDISASVIALCHSRLSDRAEQEACFRSGEVHIMIATSAFGMGVNIPDIRLIIVSQLPFSVASFYQMAGRAGRDGKRAKALLLWNDADFQMNLDIISNTDERAIDAVNELYAICESSDDLHDAVIGCFAKGGV